MTSAYRKSLFAVLLCMAISVVWGTYGAHSKAAWIDFRAIYAGTRCLIHGHNPYNVSDLEREYSSEDGQRPSGPSLGNPVHNAVREYAHRIHFSCPFCRVALGACAHSLDAAYGRCVFRRRAPDMGCRRAQRAGRIHPARLHSCSELRIDFQRREHRRHCGGFLRDCGLVPAFRPHGCGWAWFVLGFPWPSNLTMPGSYGSYFVLAGGVYRKRALQSLLVTAAVGAASVLWLSHVAPHWMHDWSANLATISMRGGINEPSPNAVTGHLTPPVVDLQAAISVFRDDPRFYNTVTYLVCGALLLVWALWTLRSRFSRSHAWLGISRGFGADHADYLSPASGMQSSSCSPSCLVADCGRNAARPGKLPSWSRQRRFSLRRMFR